MQNFTKLVILATIFTTSSTYAGFCPQFVFKANISGKSNNIKAKPNFEAFRNFVKIKMASTTQSSNQTSGPNISDVTAEYNTNIGGLINEANQNIKDIATSGWEQGKADELERQSVAKAITLKDTSGNEIKLTSTDGKTFTVDLSSVVQSMTGDSDFALPKAGGNSIPISATGNLYSFAFQNPGWTGPTAVNQNDGRQATVTATVNLLDSDGNLAGGGATYNSTDNKISIPLQPTITVMSNIADPAANTGANAYAVLKGDETNGNTGDTFNTLSPSAAMVSSDLSPYTSTSGYPQIDIPITTSFTLASDKPLYHLEDDDDDGVNVDDKYLLDVGNSTTTTDDPLIAEGKKLLELPNNRSNKQFSIEGSVEAGVIFNISDIGFLGLTVGGNAAFSKSVKLDKETTNTEATTTGTESTWELKSKPSFTLALEGGANITKKIGLGVRGKYINKRYELTHSREDGKYTSELSTHQFEIGPVIRANLTKNFSIEAGVAFCPGSKLIDNKNEDKGFYHVYTTPSASISLGAAFRI